MDPVSLRPLQRIQVLGQDDVRQSAHRYKAQQLGVNGVVVRAAQTASVARGSATAMLPPGVVMVLEHFRTCGAARDNAASIAGKNGALHPFGEEALGSAQIQRLPVGSENHPEDFTLADQLAAGPSSTPCSEMEVRLSGFFRSAREPSLI